MDALRAVAGPDGRDIVAAGLVDGIQIKDGLVQLALRTDRAQVGRMERVELRKPPRCCADNPAC